MTIELQKNGTLIINHPIKEQKNVIRVIKDGIEYRYNHTTNISIIPLSIGKGEYEVSIFEQVQGNKYKLIHCEKVINNSDDISMFLCPNKIVNYSTNSIWIKDLESIKNGGNIVDNVSNLIQNKLKYDPIKAKNINDYRINGEYIPDTNIIYKSGAGICYDYAVLFASMLRYLGIPCKVIFGYIEKNTLYHAWNEVLIDGKWIRYDITLIDTAGVKNYNDYKNKYIY